MWEEMTFEQLDSCSGHILALDVETNGLNWWEHHIIGIGVWCPALDLQGYISTLDQQRRWHACKIIDSWEPGTTIIAHNMKFDFHMLGLSPRNRGWNLMDTTIMIHLVDSRLRKNMERAEQIFLSGRTKKVHLTEAPKRKKHWEWPTDILAEYCINDCRVTWELAKVLTKELHEGGLWDLFLQQMSFMGLVWEVERRGVKIDPEFIQRAKVLLDEHLKELEEELFVSSGFRELPERNKDGTPKTNKDGSTKMKPFNWRSPQQLSYVLYEGMGHPRPKNPFADADGVDRSKFAGRLYNKTMTNTFLLMEKAKHPLGELIAAMRETSILINTLKKWLILRDKNDMIHTNFNTTGTKTGRLSSSNPNLQNIASEARSRFTQGVFSGGTERTEEYNLRNAYIAREGHVFVAIDYKQMEMRMFGLLSGDPFMIKSLAAGRDIHGDMANLIWGDRSTVAFKTRREWAKTISFGLVYGMTVGSLMHRLNMAPGQAKKITDDYWKTFPRIQPWMNDVIESCEKFGYVRYWSGRVWVEEDPAKFYKGANATIQGGCADLLSVAALRCDKWLKANDSGRIVSFIHDELMFEIPKDRVDEAIVELQKIMEVEDIFNHRFLTDVKVGPSYGSLEEV